MPCKLKAKHWSETEDHDAPTKQLQKTEDTREQIKTTAPDRKTADAGKPSVSQTATQPASQPANPRTNVITSGHPLQGH